MDDKFSYSASVKSLIIILLLEGALLWMMPQMGYTGRDIVILCLAFMGVSSILIVSKEVIFEYKDSVTILGMFLLTILQFIFFFATQYWFLILVSPDSFSGFANLPIDFLLQSTLIFLFNPTIIPHTEVARALVLMNLFSSMIILMFILQNIWYFKPHSAS